MSYFMTISGAVTAADVPATALLVPAANAQAYVAKLESSIARLDGAPVFLVDDGESGTSHNLVSQVGDALVEDRQLREVPFIALLERCIRNGWHFRVWLADNDPLAYVKNTTPVANFDSVLENMKQGRVCVCWHAS